MLDSRKSIWSWAMYDWANSAFATTVMAGFFPLFFKAYWANPDNPSESTFYLGMANSIASIIVAALAPFLGAIADRGTAKKKFLFTFAFLGVVMTGGLWMVAQGYWQMAVLLYVLAAVGFSGGNIFYDSLLPGVASEKKVNYVSSLGFSLGYIGGGLLFLLNVLWYLNPGAFGFPVEASSKIEQDLSKNIEVIQLDDESDFSLPEGFSKGRAIITSEFSALITKIETTDVYKVEVILPEDPEISQVGRYVSFGKDTLEKYDYKRSAGLLRSTATFLISNPPPKILSQDSAIFIGYINGSDSISISLPIKKINKVEARVVGASLPKELNISTLKKSISFGKYKKGDFLRFNPDSTFLVSNLTRSIDGSDSSSFVLRNMIDYSDFEDDKLVGVQGLENHFGSISITTDFLSDEIESLPIRISFLSVAIWWVIFSLPILLFVKEPVINEPVKFTNAISLGWAQLVGTLKEIRHLKVVGLFLLAYWLYIDGVDTIVRMAVDYGMTIGFESSSLILALLLVQFVAFPSALIYYKWVAGKVGTKQAILIAIIAYGIITFLGYFMDKEWHFYTLAIMIGLFQGGIQALSRSLYTRIIPAEKAAEFFGFYNMLGKFAAVIGPAMMGTITLVTGNIRLGILSILVLFILGGYFLIKVNIEEGSRMAREYLAK